MVKRSFTLGLTFCMLLSAPIAMGEEFQPSWSVTPFVGFSLFDESRGIEDRPVYGLGAGLKLDERWGIEGSLAYVDTETTGDERSDLEIYQAAVNLLYDLGESQKLIPYLLVGGGGFYADSDEFGTASGVLLHLGVGFRYLLNQTIALKGEIRRQTFFGMLDDEGDRKTCGDLTTLVGMEFRFPEARRVAASSVPGTGMETPAVAMSATQVAPKRLEPIVVVSPRFKSGGEEILDWTPVDLEKMGDLIHEYPMSNVVVMSEADEGGLSFAQFKLQERRALRLRFFLIEHFGLDSASVKVISHVNLARLSKEALDRRIVIRFVPVENGTGLSKDSENSEQTSLGEGR